MITVATRNNKIKKNMKEKENKNEKIINSGRWPPRQHGRECTLPLVTSCTS